MADEGPGYLWLWQWQRLSQVLNEAGAPSAMFERVAHLTRPGFLGPRRLSSSEQWAELRHRNHNDVSLSIRHNVPPPYDDDNEECWSITASPQPSGRPRSRQSESYIVNDFDELLEVATQWAELAASELSARGVLTTNRARAKAEWTDRYTTGTRPLELTRLSGFVDDELPRLVEEGLRQGGISHDEAVERGVTAVKANTQDVVSIGAEMQTSDLPGLFKDRIKRALVDKFADRVADVVVAVVVEGARAFFRLD